MGKQVSGSALATLTRPTGAEPYIVIGIHWGGGTSWYASREHGGYNNNIQSISPIQSTRRQDMSCTSGNVTVTFSDTDDQMKFVLDNRNVEKAPAVVFLAFADGSPDDFIELLRGKTTGPATWDEGKRTVTFGIEAATESQEVGYSATLEDFPDIFSDAEGIPWPMIFGTCAHVPALQVRQHHVGVLKFPIKLHKVPSWTHISNTQEIVLNADPDVFSYIDEPPIKNKIYVDGGSTFPQDQEISIVIGDVVFKGSMKEDVFFVTEANAPRYTGIKFAERPNEHADSDSKNNRVAWLAPVQGTEPISLVNHHVYFKVPGTKARQWYNYIVNQVGNKVWFRYPTVHPSTEELILVKSTETIEAAYAITKNGMTVDIEGIIKRINGTARFRKKVPDKIPFGRLVSMVEDLELQDSSWWQAASDEEVHLWDLSDPDIYLASLVELESIKAVFGKRKVKTPDGKTKEVFEQIPKKYYTEQLQSNYEVAGMLASGLLFYKPLSSYAGQDWTGEVYVTATSTVGPNSVDIIEWIFDHWTDLSTDSSFNRVNSDVDDHEAHFAIFDKRDALRVASEIAYQSRCALIVDSELVGIRFLADPPTPLSLPLSEVNTELDGLLKTFTSTGEVTTKLIASWTGTYREKNKLLEIYQKNVNKTERLIQSMIPSNRRRKSETRYAYRAENVNLYGLNAREEACYIYVNESDVHTFLNFWGHRYANSWQLVSVKIPLEGAILQVFDGINLTYSDTSLFGGPVLGEIQEVEVDPSDWSVRLLIWLPRRAGNNAIDTLAWPGN